MSNLYNSLVKEKLADEIIALAESYESEEEYIADYAGFGKDVQTLLVEHGTKWTDTPPLNRTKDEREQEND